VLQAIAGPDPCDATSQAIAPELATAAEGEIRGLRIGVPRSLLTSAVDAEVMEAFEAAIEVLRQQGATTVEIGLPHNDYAVSVYYLIATAEASSNLSRYDGVRYGFRAPDADTLSRMYDLTRDGGFGPEVKRRILLGTYVLSAGYYDAYYRKAQQVRTLIRRDYATAFEHVDLIALPTSPVPAFLLGERISDPLQMYLADVFTVGASLAGLPAISVPCGFTAGGLPVGLQLVAPALDEATMIRAAAAYERMTPFSGTQPQVA
jgi:aspartyl-tRNA(Asn)/glutamyl-tRNA(Gln) amidotransferase subunit A